MPSLLSADQFKSTIKARAILYFPEPELKTNSPHYFICIGNSIDGELIFSCCTSQFATVQALIERNRYPQSTLVYINETDTDNPFHKRTYINCNEYFPYLIGELWELYVRGLLTIHGELPLHSFEQILIGFADSNQIEEELKANLPNIDDF